jgi:hypothetical protein
MPKEPVRGCVDEQANTVDQRLRLPIGPVRDPVREVPGQGVVEPGDHCAALGCQGEQGGAAVGGVGTALDQARGFESVGIATRAGSVDPDLVGQPRRRLRSERFTGFSLGSGLAAAVLAAHVGGNGQPTLGGYTAVLWISVGFCVLAAALAWFLPTRSTRLTSAERLSADRIRLLEQIDGDDLSS